MLQEQGGGGGMKPITYDTYDTDVTSTDTENVEHIGPVWLCEYGCGEWHRGEPVGVQMLDLESLAYDDSALVIPPEVNTSDTGRALFVGRFILEKSTSGDAYQCPTEPKTGTFTDDATVFEDAWMCINCEDYWETREEAESCCERVREDMGVRVAHQAATAAITRLTQAGMSLQADLLRVHQAGMVLAPTSRQAINQALEDCGHPFRI